MCQTGSVINQSIERRGAQDEDYPRWRRFGQERVSNAWRGSQREASMATETHSRRMAEGVAGEDRTWLRDWDGSLWWRAPLGTQAPGERVHGEVDRPSVCEALCKEQQERRQRCRGDL